MPRAYDSRCTAPFLAPSDVRHAVYHLLIGDDLDTLRSNAPLAVKALALADIVLIVFPPEKVAKAGVIGVKLIRGPFRCGSPAPG